ncbi:MAG TPA: hypothetical protein VFT05_01530 [Burkholderiaceae bacterium]|nr:hypothetical protein [Burkholderiaceae bacterium]
MMSILCEREVGKLSSGEHISHRQLLIWRKRRRCCRICAHAELARMAAV